MLFRRVFAGVQVDGCPSCGGSWFDGGELKALVADLDQLRGVDREFQPGIQPSARKEIVDCPRCENRLTEMAHPSLPDLLVDACRGCRGIFLDHGEPTKIADAREPPSAGGVMGASMVSAHQSISEEESESPRSAGLEAVEPALEPSSLDAPSREEAKLELILRVLGIPVVLLLAYMALQSDGLRMVGKMFMAMWVHELGHASMAWLFGHFAIPGPWVAWTGETRNILVVLIVAGAIVALGLHGARKRSWIILSLAGLLLLFQIIATGFASRQTASAMITFFGDGGQLVIGMLLMLTVYSARGSKLYEGWLRWGLLVIGAVAFADALHTWLPARTDFGAIPFGMQSRAGLSDASRLVEHFGWDERALVMRHIRLAQVCGLILASAYVLGIVQSRREIKAADSRS